MKIYAPVKDFDGLRNIVRFGRGVGETDNPQVIEWFRCHGYRVEKCELPSQVRVEKCDHSADLDNTVASEPKFDSMTPNELRDWMRENGYGSKIKNTRDKEKLLKILRG